MFSRIFSREPKKSIPDPKDLLIDELKAENLMLKTKERDFNQVHSELLELQFRFKIINEEKLRLEIQLKDREELLLKNNDNLKFDLELSRNALSDKMSILDKMSSENSLIISELKMRDVEINNLKKEIALLTSTKSNLFSDVQKLDLENKNFKDSYYIALKDLEKSNNLVNSLLNEKKILEEKCKAIESNFFLEKKDSLFKFEKQESVIGSLSVQKHEGDEKIRKLENDLLILSQTSTMEGQKKSTVIDSLMLDKKSLGDKIRSLETELYLSQKKLEETTNHLLLREKENQQLRAEISLREEKMVTKENDLTNLYLLNSKLKDEAKLYENRCISQESKINSIEGQLLDSSRMLEIKAKELRDTQLNLSRVEEKNIEKMALMDQMEKEKKLVEKMMEEYKREGLINKKLKEEESVKATLLEMEKEKLRKEAERKSLDALIATQSLHKSELERSAIQSNLHDVNYELNAIKDHTALLESQNLKLHKELDSVVILEENVRKELDRKYRFEKMKEDNLKELQRSAEKVRLSQSPSKISSITSPKKY